MYKTVSSIIKQKYESIKKGSWFIENKLLYVNVSIPIPKKGDFFVKIPYEELKAISTQASFDGEESKLFLSDLEKIFSVYQDFIVLSSIRKGFEIKNYKFGEMIKLRDYIPNFSKENYEKHTASYEFSLLWRLGFDISLFSDNYQRSSQKTGNAKPKPSELPYILQQLATNPNDLKYTFDSYSSIVKSQLRSPILIANEFLQQNILSRPENVSILSISPFANNDNFVLVKTETTCDTYLIPHIIHKSFNESSTYSLSPQHLTLCRNDVSLRERLKSISSSRINYFLHPEALNKSNLSLLKEFALTRENCWNLSGLPRVYIISRENIFEEFSWMKVITIKHEDLKYAKNSGINSIKIVYSEKESSGKTYYIKNHLKSKSKTIYIDESSRTLPKIEHYTHLGISNYLFENDIWFIDELWSLTFFGYHIYSDNSILFFKQIKELILEIPCISNWDLPFMIQDNNITKHEPPFQTIIPNDNVQAMWRIISKKEYDGIYKDIFFELIHVFYHKFTHKEMISRIENMRELVFISNKCDRLGELFYDHIVTKERNEEKKVLLCLSFFRSVFQQSNLVPPCYRGYLYLLPHSFMGKSPKPSEWILIFKYPLNQSFIPQWKYNNRVICENEVINVLTSSNIISYGDEWSQIINHLGFTISKCSSFSFTPTVFSRFIQLICKSHFSEPVILSGPTGCGKTSMVHFFGELANFNIANSFIKIQCHSGTTIDDIKKRVESSLLKSPHMYVFLDEVNTSENLSSICEYILHYRPDNNTKVSFIAAINPLSKQSPISKALSSVGIIQERHLYSSSFQIFSQQQKMSVFDSDYNVFPLPTRLSFSVIESDAQPFDDNSSNELLKEEENSLSCIINSFFDMNNDFSNKFEAHKLKYKSVIISVFKYIWDLLTDRTSLTYRDLNRVLHYWVILEYKIEKSRYQEDKILASFLISIYMCIILKFSNRVSFSIDKNSEVHKYYKSCFTEYQEYIHQSNEMELSEQKCFLNWIDSIPKYQWCKEMNNLKEFSIQGVLPKLIPAQISSDAMGVTINFRDKLYQFFELEVLNRFRSKIHIQNLFDCFAIFRCEKYLNEHIIPFHSVYYHLFSLDLSYFAMKRYNEQVFPTLFIGMPGTSKTLAIELFYKYKAKKEFYCSTHLCSKSSVSDCLISHFYDCLRAGIVLDKQHKRMCFLDELGLATWNKSKPLKPLHYILDQGLDVCYCNVAIFTASASNYLIDSANQNRCLMICTDSPSREEIISSFSSFLINKRKYKKRVVYNDKKMKSLCESKFLSRDNSVEIFISAVFPNFLSNDFPIQLSIRPLFRLFKQYFKKEVFNYYHCLSSLQSLNPLIDDHQTQKFFQSFSNSLNTIFCSPEEHFINLLTEQNSNCSILIKTNDIDSQIRIPNLIHEHLPTYSVVKLYSTDFLNESTISSDNDLQCLIKMINSSSFIVFCCYGNHPFADSILDLLNIQKPDLNDIATFYPIISRFGYSIILKNPNFSSFRFVFIDSSQDKPISSSESLPLPLLDRLFHVKYPTNGEYDSKYLFSSKEQLKHVFEIYRQNKYCLNTESKEPYLVSVRNPQGFLNAFGRVSPDYRINRGNSEKTETNQEKIVFLTIENTKYNDVERILSRFYNRVCAIFINHHDSCFNPSFKDEHDYCPIYSNLDQLADSQTHRNRAMIFTNSKLTFDLKFSGSFNSIYDEFISSTEKLKRLLEDNRKRGDITIIFSSRFNADKHLQIMSIVEDLEQRIYLLFFSQNSYGSRLPTSCTKNQNWPIVWIEDVSKQPFSNIDHLSIIQYFDDRIQTNYELEIQNIVFQKWIYNELLYYKNVGNMNNDDLQGLINKNNDYMGNPMIEKLLAYFKKNILIKKQKNNPFNDFLKILNQDPIDYREGFLYALYDDQKSKMDQNRLLIRLFINNFRHLKNDSDDFDFIISILNEFKSFFRTIGISPSYSIHKFGDIYECICRKNEYEECPGFRSYDFHLKPFIFGSFVESGLLCQKIKEKNRQAFSLNYKPMSFKEISFIVESNPLYAKLNSIQQNSIGFNSNTINDVKEYLNYCVYRFSLPNNINELLDKFENSTNGCNVRKYWSLLNYQEQVIRDERDQSILPDNGLIGDVPKNDFCEADLLPDSSYPFIELPPEFELKLRDIRNSFEIFEKLHEILTNQHDLKNLPYSELFFTGQKSLICHVIHSILKSDKINEVLIRFLGFLLYPFCYDKTCSFRVEFSKSILKSIRELKKDNDNEITDSMINQEIVVFINMSKKYSRILIRNKEDKNRGKSYEIFSTKIDNPPNNDYPAKLFIPYAYYQSVFSERIELKVYNLFLRYPYYNIYESQINNYLSFTESVCNLFAFHPSLIYPFFSIVKSNDILTDIYPVPIKSYFLDTFEKHRGFLVFLDQFHNECLIDQLMEYFSFRDSILKDFYEETDYYTIHVMENRFDLEFILFEYIQTNSRDLSTIFNSKFKMKRTIFNKSNILGIESSKYPLTNPPLGDEKIREFLVTGLNNISLTKGVFPPLNDLKSEIEIFFRLVTANKFDSPYLKSQIILNNKLVEIMKFDMRPSNKVPSPFKGSSPLLSSIRQQHLFSILQKFGYHIE